MLDDCPVHAADGQDPWDCPEGCPDWVQHCDDVIEDIKVNGNYTRISVIDGAMLRQKYRNHLPVGEPTPVTTWKVKK